MTYERVTYRPEGGRARSIYLEVRSEGEVLLSGTEVTETGETRWTVNGTTETVHVIDKALIVRRQPMRMDNHYGWLVKA